MSIGNMFPADKCRRDDRGAAASVRASRGEMSASERSAAKLRAPNAQPPPRSIDERASQCRHRARAAESLPAFRRARRRAQFVPGQIEESFSERLEEPGQTMLRLMVGAAKPKPLSSRQNRS